MTSQDNSHDASPAPTGNNFAKAMQKGSSVERATEAPPTTPTPAKRGRPAKQRKRPEHPAAPPATYARTAQPRVVKHPVSYRLPWGVIDLIDQAAASATEEEGRRVSQAEVVERAIRDVYGFLEDE